MELGRSTELSGARATAEPSSVSAEAWSSAEVSSWGEASSIASSSSSEASFVFEIVHM